MSNEIYGEFPFNELRTPTGDYDNKTQMERAGFEETQMWSVVEGEGEDGSEVLLLRPCSPLRQSSRVHSDCRTS